MKQNFERFKRFLDKCAQNLVMKLAVFERFWNVIYKNHSKPSNMRFAYKLCACLCIYVHPGFVQAQGRVVGSILVTLPFGAFKTV